MLTYIRMKVKKLTLHVDGYPTRLRDIPTPLEELFYIDAKSSEWPARPKVAVVGSRGVTSYGKQAPATLSKG